MKDVTIIVACKDEDPKYSKKIKEGASCPVKVIWDKSYGLAVKQGVRESKTKYVLTMDGDGQHSLEEAKKLYKAFKISKCAMLIGHRRESRSSFRVLGSLFFNLLASIICGRWIVDLNSGMRIFDREKALAYASILCDGFSYTTSITISFLADDLDVEWFPIQVLGRTQGRSHVNPIHAFITLWQIIKIGGALRTRRIRKFWRENIKSRLFYRTKQNGK